MPEELKSVILTDEYQDVKALLQNSDEVTRGRLVEGWGLSRSSDVTDLKRVANNIEVFRKIGDKSSEYLAAIKHLDDSKFTSFNHKVLALGEDVEAFVSDMLANKVAWNDVGLIGDVNLPGAWNKLKASNQLRKNPFYLKKISEHLADAENNAVQFVEYFRVQGGTPPLASRMIYQVDGVGNVTFNKSTLNISTGDIEHARYFQSKRPGSKIYTFEVPKWFDDFLKENAIPQSKYKTNPMNQKGLAPKIVDPRQPGDSFELPPAWADWLQENYKKGSGKIID